MVLLNKVYRNIFCYHGGFLDPYNDIPLKDYIEMDDVSPEQKDRIKEIIYDLSVRDSINKGIKFVELESPKLADHNWYQLSHGNIVIYSPISICITGSLISGEELIILNKTILKLNEDIPFLDYTMGEYYSVNSFDGMIYLHKYLSVKDIKVSYYYHDDASVKLMKDYTQEVLSKYEKHLESKG